MTNRPSIIKSAATATLGAAATWLLLSFMADISYPSSADPSTLTSWWGEMGTPSASALIAGTTGVIIGGYLTAIGLLGAAIGVAGITNRLPRLEAIWAAASSDSLRRLLAIGLVTIYASGPAMASAANQPPSIVLVDLGPVEQANPIETATAVVDNSTLAPAPTPATWTVAPGDHLWHIAERVVQSSGTPTSVGAITTYWRRLIAENLTTIGPDPDLIFPGQILQLPTP